MSKPAGVATALPGEADVVVVLLAAGLSRRFGADKLAQPMTDGRPVGAATIALLQSAWPHVVCVVRPATPMADFAREAGVRTVECAQAVDGMGVSLAAGAQNPHCADEMSKQALIASRAAAS
ncbi:MAG: NTP transferase domain-containing protein, partial [Proteobacteria bacterium]|nr:NTP transferase domain-containing protein [Burkholderiales bacterium]